jgi:hypothetical protein
MSVIKWKEPWSLRSGWRRVLLSVFLVFTVQTNTGTFEQNVEADEVVNNLGTKTFQAEKHGNDF